MSKVSVIVPVYNVENYIEKMLESVQAQTFKDFEVILVNDGSTDKSQEIIESFCSRDARFKSFYQENGGVASSRNKGIELASSDYIVFYDPDDYIPRDALKKMYKVAFRKKADMVVGIMEEKSLGESLIYMHSQKLAKQNRISPTDKSFIGAWSMCHKMFSRKLLLDNRIRFEKLTNAEDGVFTYCVLNCAERIYGCRTIAYNYIKRPFWLEASATQTISSKYLEGLLISHQRILEEAIKLTDKYLSCKEKEEYLQALFVRFIEGEMIKGYYRNIWRADEDIIARIAERTEYYRQYITEEQWHKILSVHRDLELEKGYLTPEIIAQSPIVSIIISAHVTDEKLNLILGSIYNQQFQRFEVIVPSKNTDKIKAEFYKKPNFNVLVGDSFKDRAIKEAKGKYVAIIDEYVLYTKNSLLNMAAILEQKPELDFVSMLMKNFDGKSFSPIPCLSAAYGYTRLEKTKYDKITMCDTYFANKLFRKKVMEKFPFSGDPAKDIDRIFKCLSFEKLRKGVMITDNKQEDLLRRSQTIPSPISAKLRYVKNEAISRGIEKLKYYLNKEDIKKIKGIFKK